MGLANTGATREQGGTEHPNDPPRLGLGQRRGRGDCRIMAGSQPRLLRRLAALRRSIMWFVIGLIVGWASLGAAMWWLGRNKGA